MPLSKGTRVRVATTKTGKRIRLAFKNGKVVEAKKLPKRKVTVTKRPKTTYRKRKRTA